MMAQQADQLQEPRLGVLRVLLKLETLALIDWPSGVSFLNSSFFMRNCLRSSSNSPIKAD